MLPEWHEIIVDSYVKIDGVIFSSSYLREAWTESHRHFHTLKHLDSILSKIKRDGFSGVDREILVLVAYYHDVIYDPNKFDNEERCAELVRRTCTHTSKDRIIQIILDTKHHDSSKIEDPLSLKFCEYDVDILRSTDYQELLNYETEILKEFQLYNYKDYKVKRAEFLKHAAVQFNNPLLSSLAEYVLARTLKVGLYCGTFNPFHIGHYSVLYKAEQIFDKVILCSGVNPEKINVTDQNEQMIKEILEGRRVSIKKILPYHHVHVFSYSIPRLLEEFGDFQVSIVKGIRGSKDLEEENLQRAYIEDVVEDYSIIYIPADRKVEHVSSSGLRYLEQEGKKDSRSKDWANMYKCDLFQPHPIQNILN
jgi:pantetheine-phosphate adenylyltransferase